MLATHDARAERDHRLARLLRHEVGDLLQSVYSTVAVLLERLPEQMTLERRLAADLKKRAELCRGELDAVVELAGSGTAALDRLELAGVIAPVVGQIQRRYPALRFETEPSPPDLVVADANLLAGALWLLLAGLCQGARQRLEIGYERTDRYVDCMVERDGVAVSAEQLLWLQTPFATTQQPQLGLGLALTQRAVQGGGGEVQASNRKDSGVVVRIRFPVSADVP
jgi:K+-sensing histidine kinase KdpD